MQYTIQEIATITKASLLNRKAQHGVIEHLLLDSRNITFTDSSLFIAINGRHFNAHDFLSIAYQQGIRHFMIEEERDITAFPAGNFLLVKNTVTALQDIATYHRQNYRLPIIGITGSNGKTTVKEWLFQLLNPDEHIVRSPKSYNSQVGVPLSVLQINKTHSLGIFEAGISEVDEMKRLAPMIVPDIGLFTTLGTAHDEGFPNQKSKLWEKLQLFNQAKVLIYNCDDELVTSTIPQWAKAHNPDIQLINWSQQSNNAQYKVDLIHRSTTLDHIRISGIDGASFSIRIPFSDSATIENAIHCCIVMKHLQYSNSVIAARIAKLERIAMRLELKEGTNGCSIINDSYNSDLSSLSIALDFLKQQSGNPSHTLILSDIYQTGKTNEQLYHTVARLILAYKIDRLIGIGEDISMLDQILPLDFNKVFYKDTDAFLSSIPSTPFINENILLKGARNFEFEKIANRLANKVHKTRLEVNLTALLNNLRFYQKNLKRGTQLMVMVKASAYGSGSIEVAKLLAFQQVDYLAVAYADEGVELRKAGIQLPILVLNPEAATFDHLIRYQLEPEIYHFNLLTNYLLFLKKKNSPHKHSIHLKLDTGMHRLGFEEKDMHQLLNTLKDAEALVDVKSIFSHLAASENPDHDSFSKQQIDLFNKCYQLLVAGLGYQPIRHMLNSSGILRFPEHQMDMVRLGIGLYGIGDGRTPKGALQTVNTLKASISQIKTIAPGETVGYGRMGLATSPLRIATLSIGYADGLLRKTGNGRYQVLIKGKKAPLVGNVCMDMAMADITHIPSAVEGDEAIIFGRDAQGNECPVQDLALCLDTIPYEVFTSISKRVKRIYIQE